MVINHNPNTTSSADQSPTMVQGGFSHSFRLFVTVSVCILLLCHFSTDGFVFPSQTVENGKSRFAGRLNESNKDGSEASNDVVQSGYKFGDISRFLAKKATDKVNEWTGNDSYTFGDLSRYLDEKAKQRIQGVKGETDSPYKYEFGDLTRWAGNLAQEKAAQYAGKESASEYRFGDVTRTVINKVQSGEYAVEDVYLALRVLLTAGFSVMPIAGLLPIQALLSLVELGLAKDVGARVLEVLARSVDARMKEALTGNANYQLGDITKDRLQKGLASFTGIGKDSYEVGDILRAVQKRKATTQNKSRNQLSLDEDVLSDLRKWDEQFLKEHSNDLERQLPKHSS